MSSGDAPTLIVIGGGAAGIFCAVNAARLAPHLRVVVIEKSNKLLSKVKVSGGGRCNVTHACFDRAQLPSYYPRGATFVKRYVHSFFTTDTIDWFAARGVTLKTESDNRMFPVTDRSQTIIDVLLKEAARYQVSFRMQQGVVAIERNEQGFALRLDNGETLGARYCCIASGGYPKAASFDWIQALGHTVMAPVPSLFTFNAPSHPLVKLQGVTVPDVRVRVSGSKLVQSGPLLVTHWGLSGPAILKLSAWGARELATNDYAFEVQINWMGASGPTAEGLGALLRMRRLEHPAQKVVNANCTQLPQRLWEFLLEQASTDLDTRLGDWPRKEENRLIRSLTDMVIPIKGKTTFKEEFVTAGGVSLSEVEASTMMSKKVPGLYFAGEVLDVDGVTGGFNFQHAWSSGMIAAQAIADQASAQPPENRIAV